MRNIFLYGQHARALSVSRLFRYLTTIHVLFYLKQMLTLNYVNTQEEKTADNPEAVANAKGRH